MSTKSLIIRMIIKLALLAVLTFAIFIIFDNTVLSNEIAMGQMENSNEFYFLMQMYNKIRTYASVAYGCVSAIIVGTAIYDINIFIKNEGEN